jgi:asparagine synthase (glutamine-hydrolysing)
MCGITGGVWTRSEQAIDSGTLSRMTRAITHRGPDDEGSWRQEVRMERLGEGTMPGVALGFRRLSIIDLEGGHQPLSNEDGSVWLVFNGEIYNFPALRRRLEGAGHRFRTRSDSETIVHLYEDEGLNVFDHLNGMFAIAIWDARRRRLVLGRDRLGEKPLVYRQDAGRLLFGSELKSLREVPGISFDIDPQALDEYFTYQYVPFPRTIYRQAKKLPPGHLAVYQNEHLEVRPYWTPDFQQEFTGTRREGIERLRETMDSSVAMRLQSDVPLGAFLSGGVDSSLITALMCRHARGRVKTFSIGFPIKEYNETQHARLVAAHLQTEHHEFEVTPKGIDILPQLVWHYDEPFADSSAIPTWYLSEMTRQHVTVALTGDGGDELFLGYPRYQAVALASRIDQCVPVRQLLGSALWQRLPAPARQKSRLRQWKRFTESLRMSSWSRYLDWISIFNESRRAELYTDDFIAQLPGVDPVRFLEEGARGSSRRDPVTAVALTDLGTYLPCDLMYKVDIASMAHSLECRPPFLDHRVVELAASFPRHWKFRWGRGKQILRHAFGDLLPDSIWQRRKMGFGVPLDYWFRHELKELTREVLLDPSTMRAGRFRREGVERLIREHVDGQFDHAYRLWALLVFELWRRRWCPGA